MKDARKLAALGRLSQMRLDAELARLRAAARAREASLAALEALKAPDESPGDLSPVAAGLAQLSYRRWAEARRAEINVTLARQTAEWAEARDRAALAFGRTQSLDGLAMKLKKAQKRQD
ncbi:hypothetical protein [Acidimangrovimonas sediminis]|uniref:hypothetical protein n=1 Tax=Acidimangrovimonas sediminis TaxID=2056283 RepID=UPI000C7FEB18|nr:hypothetical protein [Acidimangrovimonas sediminis]